MAGTLFRTITTADDRVIFLVDGDALAALGYKVAVADERDRMVVTLIKPAVDQNLWSTTKTIEPPPTDAKG